MTQQVTMKEAKELINKKKLVFVDFFTSWCYPCSLLAEKIEKNEEELFHGKENVAFVKVNVDDSKATSAWARKCGMEVIPTIAVFVNGEQIRIDYTRDGEVLKDQQCMVGNFDEAIPTIKKIIKQYA